MEKFTIIDPALTTGELWALAGIVILFIVGWLE